MPRRPDRSGPVRATLAHAAPVGGGSSRITTPSYALWAARTALRAPGIAAYRCERCPPTRPASRRPRRTAGVATRWPAPRGCSRPGSKSRGASDGRASPAPCAGWCCASTIALPGGQWVSAFSTGRREPRQRRRARESRFHRRAAAPPLPRRRNSATPDCRSQAHSSRVASGGRWPGSERERGRRAGTDTVQGSAPAVAIAAGNKHCPLSFRRGAKLEHQVGRMKLTKRFVCATSPMSIAFAFQGLLRMIRDFAPATGGDEHEGTD